MQYRALRTFKSRHGMVRAGMVLTLEEKYAQALMRHPAPLIEAVALPQAPLNVALPGAQQVRAGESKAGALSAGRPDAGGEKPSSVRRRGRPSKKKTLNIAEAEPG